MNTSTKLSTQEDRNAVHLNEDPHCCHAEESFLDVKVINQLYEARDRLKEFSESIGFQKETPIREDVVSHCDKIKNLKNQAYSYEKIERIVKYRIQKIIKNKRIKKNWGQEDISILIWVISKYADYVGVRNVQKDLNEDHWTKISEMIPGVKPDSCMFKWLSLKRNKLADYGWSQKESLMLDELVTKHGDDWAKISELLYFKSKSINKVYRCPKQCREHWNCYLNPALKKGLWELEEDFILLTEIRKRHGEKRWTELTQFLTGRTENALKNRYNLIIDKQKGNRKHLKNLAIQQQLQLVDTYLSKHFPQRFAKIVEEERAEPLRPLLQKNHKVKIQNSNQNYSETMNLFKKQARAQINDSESEEKQVDLDYGSNNYVFSTPKIFENHIIQMNSLDCTPIYLPTYSKMVEEQDMISSNRQMPDFYEDSKKEAMELIQYQDVRENGQFHVDVQKIHIISISENNMLMFTELVKNGESNGCSFVPCKINGENKLTKLNY